MKRLAILTLALLLCYCGATAQAADNFTTTQTEGGPTIEFTQGEYILADGIASPKTGWKQARNPYLFRMNETGWRTGDFHSVTGRFRFDRSAVGKAPLALFTVSTRNQFTVAINGEEIFRNFASVGDQKLAWYRPYLVPLPSHVLRPGMNEVVIHAVSQDSVGIGRVVIGPDPAMQSHFQSQYFWQISAPMAANFAMLVLGILAFMFWLGRRDEMDLLWLSVSTTIWFLRNYQYFAEVTPFDMAIFNALTVYATYFATISTFAFYANFLKLPHRNRMIFLLMLLGVLLSAAHTLLSTSNLVFYIPSTLIAFGMAVLGFTELRSGENMEHKILGLVMLLMPLLSIYDSLLVYWNRGWNGGDFYLSVFNGFLYCTAFLISFGLRARRAFADLSVANVELEQRIEEARLELAASEAARQELVVGNALAGERERLMQEMHDGIGSNLITALAVARQQQQPESTIKTLNRALNDLKITVDSLEPVEGDLVALIGNLRHRMAADLRDAGISCKWDARPCGLLPWLDATNALHVLRIFQEAIGNVLTHSGATEMRIGCAEVERDGIAGIAAYVADNGCGFDPATTGSGKGLGNIRARAQSLHGILDYESSKTTGTVVTLWLPYARTAHLPPSGTYSAG